MSTVSVGTCCMIHLCGSGFGQNGSTRYVGGACARDNGPPSSIQAAHITIVITRTFARLVGFGIERSGLRGVLADEQEALHALAVEHLARIEIAFGIGGDHVQPEELAAVLTHAAQLSDRRTSLAIDEPDV